MKAPEIPQCKEKRGVGLEERRGEKREEGDPELKRPRHCWLYTVK